MFKPLVNLFCTIVLASAVLAQNVYIAYPTSGTKVTAGSKIIVQVDQPMSLTGSVDVSLVIGTFPCTSGVCPGASQVLGDILYQGPYNATMHSDSYEPYQNISVTVPSSYSGIVQLGVAHFYLLGAGLSAQLQTTNITLNVD